MTDSPYLPAQRRVGLYLLCGGALTLPFADTPSAGPPLAAGPQDDKPRDLVTLRHGCRRAWGVANCAQCPLFPCGMADF